MPVKPPAGLWAGPGRSYRGNRVYIEEKADTLLRGGAESGEAESTRDARHGTILADFHAAKSPNTVAIKLLSLALIIRWFCIEKPLWSLHGRALECKWISDAAASWLAPHQPRPPCFSWGQPAVNRPCFSRPRSFNPFTRSLKGVDRWHIRTPAWLREMT